MRSVIQQKRNYINIWFGKAICTKIYNSWIFKHIPQIYLESLIFKFIYTFLTKKSIYQKKVCE